MTRENILVLLRANGRDLADGEADCEIETARQIGAPYVVTADIQRLGSAYKLSLRLHRTHDGQLLGSATASVNSVEALDEAVRGATEKLYAQR